MPDAILVARADFGYGPIPQFANTKGLPISSDRALLLLLLLAPPGGTAVGVAGRLLVMETFSFAPSAVDEFSR